jgi:hypothetical protein
MTSTVLESPIEIFNDIMKESTPSEREKDNLCTRIIKRKFKCILLGLVLLLIFSQILNTILPTQTPINITLQIPNSNSVNESNLLTLENSEKEY